MKLTNAAVLSACLAYASAKSLLEAPKATIEEYDATDAPLMAVVPQAVAPKIESEVIEDADVADVVEETEEPVEETPKENKHVPTKEEQAAAAEVARQKMIEEAEKVAEEKQAAEEAAYRATVAQRWETMNNFNFYARSIWLGMFQGFYGMSMKAKKPTEDCFGNWVPDSAHELVDFAWDVRYNFMGVTYTETETAAYDVVDLLFRNDEYCYFRQTFWDMYEFCHTGENCSEVWSNVQTNAFSIITQLSASIAAVKGKPWGELGRDQKGYMMNTLGKSVAQIISDVIGFGEF